MQKPKSPKYSGTRPTDWSGQRRSEQGSVGRCFYSHKLQYETEEAARTAAKQFRKSHGPRLQQYLCHKCSHWHNGHNRKGKPFGKAFMKRKGIDPDEPRTAEDQTGFTPDMEPIL